MGNKRGQHVESGDAEKPAGPHPPDGEKESPSYIVAVGGSAGGLEAFERFFGGMPPHSGMAFVVIQHLDPNHKALMPELLQRSTEMPVRQIEDGVKVESDHIYVIPPNADLSIADGRLHLTKPAEAHGHRLPIDSFFQSLAAECGDRSVAVVVSGMGTDGTQGIKAIKEVSGVVMVESPETAKFDGMPRSAIDTGMVDHVAPIGDLPNELIAYVSHVPRLRKEISRTDVRSSGGLQRVLRLLSTRTGHDFSLYKKSTLYRRIEKRAGLHQISGISEYASFVEQNPDETDALFKELLIGVTRFFRDPGAFEHLADEVVPDLVRSAAPGGSIRVWVPACSTGEEAYSLAIIVRESVDRLRPDAGIKIQIFATDIDERAIEVARKGLYPANIVADVSPARLQGFFAQTEAGFVVKKQIRETVVFAPQDLAADPPFTKMDMVSCRNLLIYFSPELQRKVVPIFHYALNRNGILFLGTAEGIGSFDELFYAIGGKWKVFRRKETPASQKRLREIPFRAPLVKVPEFESPEEEATVDVKEAWRRMLLERYAPPSVVVTADGGIVLVSGRTGKYLELAEGAANWNVNAMAREGLRLDLPGAIQRSATHNAVVTIKGLNVKTNGDHQRVDVTVSPLTRQSGAGALFVVTFDATPNETAGAVAGSSGEPKAEHTDLEKELECVKERLQITLEEMESTSEELKSANEELESANEELQSTNEEFQSTNEELTTSKEELQSLNEELTTLNTELQSKIDDLTGLNNDVVNLMNSTQLATIFLDNELHVKRFTPAVVGTFRFRSIDVGRPITEITQNLLYETIEQDVADVLRTLSTHEQAVESKDGHWFIMRIMPFRTLDNVIDGVVVTFTDVTERRHAEDLSQALNDINAGIASSLDRENVLSTAMTRASAVLALDAGSAALREEQHWVVRQVSGPLNLPLGQMFSNDEVPFPSLVMETRAPLAIGDTEGAGTVRPSLIHTYGVKAILDIPLVAGKETIGVLSLVSTSSPVKFTDADVDFAQKLGVAVSLTLDNIRLFEAQQQAHRRLQEQHRLLQRALIPASPKAAPGYRVASRFVAGAAGEQVGGDFFDVFRTEDDELAILIGDVAGKGVESASTAAATRSILRAFTFDRVAPGQALTRTNAVMATQSDSQEQFVTVFLAVLDEGNGKLRYCSAGHPPAMIRREGGTVEMLEMAQVPVGVIEKADYQEGETSLEPGDKLLLYTDGICEAHSGTTMYDIHGVQATLRDKGGASPQDTLEAIFEAATAAGNGRLLDDAAVVIIERGTGKIEP